MVQTEVKPDTKQRSFPKPEFTDAEAGALDFPSSTSRSYNYFKPAKLRATTYEDVTFDVQPDPERHLTQGWIYGFADGPGGYPKDWTRLVIAPTGTSSGTPTRSGSRRSTAATPRSCARSASTCENAKRAEAYSHWTPTWSRFIERNLGAWMHAENGLGLHVFTAVQRSAPTNMINNAVAVAAAHKLRFAQDLALYNLDLTESGIAFDGVGAQAGLAERPGLAGRAGERRAAHRGGRLGRGAVRDQRGLRVRSSACCSAATC